MVWGGGGGVCELLVNNTFSCNLCLDRMYKGKGGGGGDIVCPFATAVGVELKPPPLVLNAGELHQGRTALHSLVI